MTQGFALRCVVCASTLVTTHWNVRIDSNPILVFPCVVLMRLIEKPGLRTRYFRYSQTRHNATQGLASILQTDIKGGMPVTEVQPPLLVLKRREESRNE